MFVYLSDLKNWKTFGAICGFRSNLKVNVINLMSICSVKFAIVTYLTLKV
jgi:hypothetical protein